MESHDRKAPATADLAKAKALRSPGEQKEPCQAQELSDEAVDSINKRYKPAYGLTVSSSLLA